MTTSASTPRIRLTQALYCAVLAAVIWSDGRWFTGLAGIAVQALGAGLVVLAVLGRLWTSFFIAGRKDAEVVMEGPYAACRHPLYLLSLAAALGVALATRSLVLIVLVPLALGLAVRGAIRREEADLAARHGAAWQSYTASVPRLWPNWRRLVLAPPVVAVHAVVYRKAFVDAAGFLALLLALLAADAMRGLGLWHAPFHLP